MGNPADYMTLQEVAAAAGITYGSARTMHGRAIKRRRENSPLAWDLPAPDKVFGRSPAWRGATVKRWLRRRHDAGYGSKEEHT